MAPFEVSRFTLKTSGAFSGKAPADFLGSGAGVGVDSAAGVGVGDGVVDAAGACVSSDFLDSFDEEQAASSTQAAPAMAKASDFVMNTTVWHGAAPLDGGSGRPVSGGVQPGVGSQGGRHHAVRDMEMIVHPARQKIEQLRGGFRLAGFITSQA